MHPGEDLVEWLKERVNRQPPPTSTEDLGTMLRAFAIWRSRALGQALIRHYGSMIMSGPFAGMDYVSAAAEGALAPRILGSYESELHPYLERFAAQDFDTVIDVGCAEGYYAVGLARMMPAATVHARDINPVAQDACRELAARNGVSDRVIVGGAFAPTDFENFAGRRCLVVIDVEGAEVDLLRPELSPALADMTLIVETHDLYRRDALETITTRFEPTHEVIRVDIGPKTTPLPDRLAKESHLDQLLAVWEWRLRPTPWLVMTPRAGG